VPPLVPYAVPLPVLPVEAAPLFDDIGVDDVPLDV